MRTKIDKQGCHTMQGPVGLEVEGELIVNGKLITGSPTNNTDPEPLLKFDSLELKIQEATSRLESMSSGNFRMFNSEIERLEQIQKENYKHFTEAFDELSKNNASILKTLENFSKLSEKISAELETVSKKIISLEKQLPNNVREEPKQKKKQLVQEDQAEDNKNN